MNRQSVGQRSNGTVRLRNGWLGKTVAAIFVFLLGAVVAGIVGNRADTAFVLLITWFITSISVNVISWLVTSVILLISVGGCSFFWLQSKVLNQALQRANKMIALDGSILRNIAGWHPPVNSDARKEAIRLILKDILRDATTEFDEQVFRAAIVQPDDSGEFLYCTAFWQMPQESIDDMKFYIGADPRMMQDRKSAASEAYREVKVIRGHMVRVGEQWICEDCRSFVPYHGDRPVQPYKTFALVPIIGADLSGTSNRTKCFGVVCFDSPYERIFDSDASLEILLNVAERIASAIILCDRLPS